ncbi:MAG: hypothetical protein FJZ01_17680 [Candidatus Sericytochromatia bacterium]|nr:hypothetical protein [Candidatus Tanganyikabacteria bacterium]
MPARRSFAALLAASLLAFQPVGAASAAPAKGSPAKAPAAKAPVAKPPGAKPPARPKAPTPIPGPRTHDSGDALVEAVGTTPELQGDQQFTNTINWTKRAITVLGIGIAPDRGTLATRRTLARSYALEDGLRQLAEVVDKVRVNAEAHVRDYTVADDEIRAKINQRIRAAKIVDTNVLPDGSVELKLQVTLFCKEGLAGAVLKDEPSCLEFAAEATTSLPTSPWTAIVIDGRGSGAQPALAPQIRSLSGQELPERPRVQYVHTLEGALDLAGERPLPSRDKPFKVKRAAGTNKADLLLDTADFAKVSDALGKGSVAIVVIL